MTAVHEPVLLEEAMRYLAPDGRDGVFVDCTVGGGGHAVEILRRAGASAKLLGFDVDGAAIKAARKPGRRLRRARPKAAQRKAAAKRYAKCFVPD